MTARRRRRVDLPKAVAVTFRAAAGVGILALMALTVADVVSRELRGGSLQGALEIGEVLLVVVVYLGMGSAQLAGQHVVSPVVTSRVKPAVADALRVVGLLASLAFLGWFIERSLHSALRAIEAGESRYGLVSVPVWPAKLALPIGMACFALVVLQQLWSILARRARARAATIGEER